MAFGQEDGGGEMKLPAWTLLTAVLSNVLPVDSYASGDLFVQGDWEFLYSDDKEADRAMCSLSGSANPNSSAEVLHIQSSPGKPIVGLMRGGLPKGGTVTWDVDGMQAAHFQIDEMQEMTPIGLRALSALGTGKKLTVYYNDKTVDTFSLNGSGAAIDKFMECWTGSNNPRKANRSLGSTYVHGTYNDLEIASDKHASVAPTIRRDVLGDDLNAYFVPVADDGKVVTKAYMFFYKDTEKAGHLVATSTLTRNALGDVETAIDDEVAGSCIESEINILCYAVGYGQLEYRLSFDKKGQPYTRDEVEAANAAAPLANGENGSREETTTPADGAEYAESDAPVVAAEIDNRPPSEADIAVIGTGYADPNRNIAVESFGQFTSMNLQDADLTDIAGKKLIRTVNHFTHPEAHMPTSQEEVDLVYMDRQAYHYEFEIKNRFASVGEDNGTKVKFNLKDVREENGSLHSTITSVEMISGNWWKRNIRRGGFDVEQGYCVENEPLEAKTPTIKTVECKGISTKGERFGFTFVRDAEFAPKVTIWDVRKEKQAYEQTREVKEREHLENLERMRD